MLVLFQTKKKKTNVWKYLNWCPISRYINLKTVTWEKSCKRWLYSMSSQLIRVYPYSEDREMDSYGVIQNKNLSWREDLTLKHNLSSKDIVTGDSATVSLTRFLIPFSDYEKAFYCWNLCFAFLKHMCESSSGILYITNTIFGRHYFPY